VTKTAIAIIASVGGAVVSAAVSLVTKWWETDQAEEQTELDRQRHISESADRLMQSYETRLNNIEDRLDDAEAAEAECRERLQDEREKRRQTESRLNQKIDDLEGELEDVRREAWRREQIVDWLIDYIQSHSGIEFERNEIPEFEPGAA